MGIFSTDKHLFTILHSYIKTAVKGGTQQKYYEALEAPGKEIYIFENSAHSPIYEEYDTSKRVLEEVKKSLK